MRRYVDEEIEPRTKLRGRQLALVDALYTKGELKLEYDSAMTRNAAQAFAARSGNCLSLVIMTAAFAKALDLPVEYQKVFVDDAWARAGNIYLAIGHVNLTLGRRATDGRRFRLSRRASKPRESEGMTIDFLPPDDMRSVRSRAIGEDIVVAMYMNNRAVEALAQGKRRRRLLVGARSGRPVARLSRRVQHAGRRVPASTATSRRPPKPCCDSCSRASPPNAQAMANLVARARATSGKSRSRSARGDARKGSSRSRRSRSSTAAWPRCAPATCRPPRRRSSARSRVRPTTTSSISGSRSRTWDLGESDARAQAPRDRDAEQHDAQRPRPLRGEARPAERRCTRVERAAQRRVFVHVVRYIRSMIAAMPWPPPMHIVISA